MATLGDVREFGNKIATNAKIFKGRSFPDFYGRLQKVGDALSEDLGITLDEAEELLDDTELTPGAQKAFQELKDWLKKERSRKKR